MPVLPIIDRLPEEYLSRIGEIVTSWAVQEHELRLITYLLLSLDPKRGRLAVKNVRAKDCVDLISDLMHLSKIKSKTTKLKEMGELLDQIESRRNNIAHNIWLGSENATFFLQSLSGTWPDKTGDFKRKRKIDPAGVPVVQANLDDLVSAIRMTIRQTRLLRKEVAAALSAKGVEVVFPNETDYDQQ